MLGPTQRDWFLNKIKSSKRTWKIWGNEVMVMQLKVSNTYTSNLLPRNGDVFLNLDQWDGWPAERELILRTVRDTPVRNFVTITGDIHTFFAGYERVNFDNPLEQAVATCFVCGSITSSNLEEIATLGVGGPQLPPNRGDILSAAVMGSNPHIRYMNSSGHGYNIMEVMPQALTCTMKSVDTIKQPQANLYTLRTFRVNKDEVVIRDSTTGLPV
jgi:alkaline phosphatase D